MTFAAKVRPHKISRNVTLSASGYNLVGAGSPAIEAMTDFLRVNLVTIGASESLVDANARMISRGVRMLIVSAPDLGAAADKMRTDRGLPSLAYEAYRPMAGHEDSSLAFQAARALVFEGTAQPNGYTEPLLHAFRQRVKSQS